MNRVVTLRLEPVYSEIILIKMNLLGINLKRKKSSFIVDKVI